MNGQQQQIWYAEWNEREKERRKGTKKIESETETPEQNENEIFTLKRSTYRDQLLCIMSGKCINLDTFYYVIFFVCKRKRPLLYFSYSINFFFSFEVATRNREREGKERGKNYVGVFKLKKKQTECDLDGMKEDTQKKSNGRNTHTNLYNIFQI